MSTDLVKKEKHYFEKDFLKLMNNVIFGKIMQNVRKHRNTKLVTNKATKNYLLSELNYHTTTLFSENLQAKK